MQSLVKPENLDTEGQIFLSTKAPQKKIGSIKALLQAVKPNFKFYVYVDKLAYQSKNDANKEPVADWKRVDYPSASN